MADDIRPPVPVTMAARPVIGGIAVPFVNVVLADGGADFRTPHTAKYERCWREGLCQACGGPYGSRAVLFGGPNQLRSRHFDEPPLCPPCAAYASRACPMVAGRRERYATGPSVAQGPRGHACHEGCGCAGWLPSDPSRQGHGGDPAHPWYALYVHPGSWQLTGSTVVTRCSDEGCEHERFLLNGAFLLGAPLKVVLVSAPGEGRTWRTLDAAEVAALMPEREASGA